MHILKYMRDEEFQEWRKLISAEHIEMATRYIRRLSIALHIAFFIKFFQSLEPIKQQSLQHRLLHGEQEYQDWAEFENFLENGRRKNGTFALHYDIMVHCDEIGAIAMGERLGGELGYTLLLAAVKSSLPFSFINGAASYAAFTTKLLHEYYKCGPYYQNMKHTLFSTTIPGSDVNFALDTQREIEHREALKAFRSGSTVSSILPRMSLLDTLNDVHEETRQKTMNKNQADLLGVKTTSTDVKYITKVISLVLRREGISMTDDANVYNVYDGRKPVLTHSILDQTTEEIGKYLVRKYVANSSLFGCSKSDEPDLRNVNGPKELLQKVKASRGVTIKRSSVRASDENKTFREKKEEKRIKIVRQEFKKMDCLSSDMNACQAIVKPDCSKPKVMKSSGVKNALLDVLTKSCDSADNIKPEDCEKHFEQKNLVYLSKTSFPKQLTQTATVSTIEFAGMKFKTKSSSGQQYIRYIENAVLMKTKIQFPKVHQIAVCEEKYQFTPDDFKSATRAQKQKTSHCSITHLKTDDEILSTNKFDKKSITSSSEGKYLISTYLAKHLDKINLQADVTVDVDSELNLFSCACESIKCVHPNKKYTHPIRAIFSTRSPTKIEVLEDIYQTKGEAEMAQIDWLMEYESLLKDGESVVSIVTSGDIDAIVLHIFAVASYWPRAANDQKSFKHEVYVVLHKPGNLYDTYNITGIISLLEKCWSDKYIGQKVALVLSLGGNDFLPKFHGISHKKTLETYMSQDIFRSRLFKIETDEESGSFTVSFDSAMYKEMIKYMYTPKHLDPKHFTYEEMRQLSILPPRAKSLLEYKNPQNWIPPASAIEQLSKNVQCLAEYYLTAGKHDAPLPNFLENGCLQRLPDGTIEYNLGRDSSIKEVQEAFTTDHADLLGRIKDNKKRRQDDTPQKGARRKLKPKATSTPKKSCEKK